MKKIIGALFGLFISVSAFADNDGNIADPNTVSTRITIPWQLIEEVLNETPDLKPGLEAMREAYYARMDMSEDNKLTTGDMWEICKASKLIHKLSDCYNRIILPVYDKRQVIMFANACSEESIKNTFRGHCVGGLFSKGYSFKGGCAGYKVDDTYELFHDKWCKVYKYKTTLDYAQDVSVPEHTAFGLAIEYIRLQGYELNNIRCTPTVNDNWINCTAWNEREHPNLAFYSFHFTGTHNNEESSVEENTIRGICALNKADYMKNDCSDLNTWNRVNEEDCRPGCDMNCDSGYASGKAKVDQIKKFNMKASWGANAPIPYVGDVIVSQTDARPFCKIWRPNTPAGGDAWNSDDMNFYPNHEDLFTAFTGIKAVNDNEMQKILKLYVMSQGIDVTSFSCTYGTKKYTYDPMWVDMRKGKIGGERVESFLKLFQSMSGGKTYDYLTCNINGKPVDFLFDTLYETNPTNIKVGKDGVKCLFLERQSGKTARFDGKNCIGPDEQQCLELGRHVGGAHIDPDTGYCVLDDAEAAYKIEKRNNYLKNLGLGLAFGSFGGKFKAVIATVMFFEAPVVIQDIGQSTLESMAHGEVDDAIKALAACRLPTDNSGCTDAQTKCAKQAAGKIVALMTQFYDQVGDPDMNRLNQALGDVESCKWSGPVYADVIANVVPQQAAIIQAKHVWVEFAIVAASLVVFISPGAVWNKITRWGKLRGFFDKAGIRYIESTSRRFSTTNGSLKVQEINLSRYNASELEKIRSTLQARKLDYADFSGLYNETNWTKFVDTYLTQESKAELSSIKNLTNAQQKAIMQGIKDHVGNNIIYSDKITGTLSDFTIRVPVNKSPRSATQYVDVRVVMDYNHNKGMVNGSTVFFTFVLGDGLDELITALVKDTAEEKCKDSGGEWQLNGNTFVCVCPPIMQDKKGNQYVSKLENDECVKDDVATYKMEKCKEGESEGDTWNEVARDCKCGDLRKPSAQGGCEPDEDAIELAERIEKCEKSGGKWNDKANPPCVCDTLNPGDKDNVEIRKSENDECIKDTEATEKERTRLKNIANNAAAEARAEQEALNRMKKALEGETLK